MKTISPREEIKIDRKTARQHACTMRDTDGQGHANLCCCYIMGADGKLHDPCYHPADQCCH